MSSNTPPQRPLPDAVEATRTTEQGPPAARWVFPAAAVAVSLLVQGIACLPGSFVSDDFLHLFLGVDSPTLKCLFAGHGGHAGVTFRAIFLALYAAFGLEPTPWFVVVLCLHALNVFLLYDLVERLTASRTVAAGAAGIWGSALVHGGSLGWLSVLGQVLGTVCLLFTLRDLVRRALRSMAPSTATVVAYSGLGLVAAMGFGTGIATAVAVPVSAWLLFPPAQRKQVALRLLAVPLTVGCAFVLFRSVTSDTTMLIAAPPPLVAIGLLKLASFGIAALLAGPLITINDARVGITLGDTLTPTMAVALSFLVSVPLLAVLGPVLKRSGSALKTSAALAVPALAAYGIIAVGRARLVLGDTAVLTGSEPRYHYLATALLAGSLGVAVHALVESRRNYRFGLSALALAVACANVSLAPRAKHSRHESTKLHIKQAESAIRLALRGTTSKDVYIHNMGFIPLRSTLERKGSAEEFPHLAAFFAVRYESDTRNGRRLHFVEPDLELVKTIRSGPSLRLKKLLTTTPEALALGVTVEGMRRDWLTETVRAPTSPHSEAMKNALREKWARDGVPPETMQRIRESKRAGAQSRSKDSE